MVERFILDPEHDIGQIVEVDLVTVAINEYGQAYVCTRVVQIHTPGPIRPGADISAQYDLTIPMEE
jgi:hypothetical protein